MKNSQLLDNLLSLGLSQLEAEVYICLLPEEPMTAYRIGKLLGKPTANVYKAIDALVRKGAVLIEEGKSRKCRAVAPALFIKQLRTDFERKATTVTQSLIQLKKHSFDEDIYKVGTVALALEKGREMLKRSEKIVVIDAFPEAARSSVTGAGGDN